MMVRYHILLNRSSSAPNLGFSLVEVGIFMLVSLLSIFTIKDLLNNSILNGVGSDSVTLFVSI